MIVTFDQILTPLDLSATADHAVPIASNLAVALDLPLQLVTVSSPFADERADQRALDERLVDTPPGSSARAIRDSAVVGTIVRVAHEAGALLCMSTHGRGVLGRAVIGSVSRDVLAASDRPVVLVGPRVDVSRAGPPRSILFGTDGSLAVRPGDALVWMARRLQVRVHVVAVDETPGVIAPGGAVTGLPLVEHVEALCAQLEQLGVDARPTVTHDDHVARVLCDIASTLPAPLVVLASRTSGLAGQLGLGSTSTGVVRDGPAPVLVVPR